MSEVSEIAMVFAGLGMLTIYLTLAYFLYQIVRFSKNSADLDEKKTYYELHVLDDMAQKKGMNIDKYQEKTKMFKNKTFQKRLEQELMKEAFKDIKK